MCEEAQKLVEAHVYGMASREGGGASLGRTPFMHDALLRDVHCVSH